MDMKEFASDDPDLTEFRDAGKKLIIIHDTNDPVIPSDGTIDYYDHVVDIIGSKEETKKFTTGSKTALRGNRSLPTSLSTGSSLRRWIFPYIKN